MSLKSWKSEWKPKRKRSKPWVGVRVKMDHWMIAATFLSAIATASTGVIAYYQYRNMERALTVDTKNAKFEAFVDEATALCELYRSDTEVAGDIDWELRRDGIVSRKNAGLAAEMVRTKLPKLIAATPPLLRKANSAVIWSTPAEAEQITVIMMNFVMMEGLFDTAPSGVGLIFASKILLETSRNCQSDISDAVQAYAGSPPDIPLSYAVFEDRFKTMLDEDKPLFIASERGPK